MKEGVGEARKTDEEGEMGGGSLGLWDYVIIFGALSLAQRPERDPGFSPPSHISGVQLGPRGAVGLCPPFKAADLTALVPFDSHNVTLNASRPAGSPDPHDDLNTSNTRA